RHVKTNLAKEPMTELTAAAYLKEQREAVEDYLDESFDTIAAYGANAAMMHYSATEKSHAKLQQKGFLLVDSGAHYLNGTTDITRTVCLGSTSKEERFAYTRVLRASLRLMAAHFPKGTYSQNLDILARGPLWDEGLDYRCGTGHGVGHILNVHEGPNGFRAKVNDAYPLCELKPGMITTDEPGLYEEDKFGIRIENELLCVEDKKTQYGQFYSFEVLTMAPIDLDPVETSMLTQYEKETLNAYHKRVYETLAPLLSEEEAEWLSKETRAI
ncbi:MAG: M24 family metallopeptidase, partial [Lachnospiraceae bacterium]|nr:M24 family metallopeptidase [Lachnospiraceae bacterium]